MKSILLTVFILVTCLNYQAATITSTAAGGNWSLGGSWIGGNVPVAGDDVIIQSGSTINLNVNTSCLSLTLNGILNFNTNNRTLTVLTFLTTSGNGSTTGNGVSRILNVGSDLIVPVGNSITISGFTLNVSGSTNIDGLISFSNGTGNINFLDLNLMGTGVLDASIGGLTLKIGGNWNNVSSDPDPFIEGNSRIIFNGTSGTQQISNLMGTENFYQLTINNTSVSKPAITSTTNINVTEDYDHTAGFLDLLGNDFTTAGASSAVQTFSLSGGGLISSIAGSNVSFISSAVNALTVTFTDFSIGETTSEEININLTSESSFFTNSIFYGPMVVTKIGTANNDTQGGNIFYGPITFNTTVGSDRWRMANTNPDIFYNLTINHDGDGNFILGRQTLGNEYHGTTTLNSSTAGGLFIGRSNVIAGTFSNEFFGPVNINVTLSGNVNFSESDATRIHNCIFNDLVTINSSPTSTGNVRFGSNNFGSTTFQNNGTLASGVIDGATIITLLQISHTSGLPSVVTCTGLGNIACGNNLAGNLNSFSGDIDFTAPTISIRQTTVSGNSIINSTGTTTCGDLAANTPNFFNGTITINSPTLLLRNNEINGIANISAQSFLFQNNIFNGVANMIKTNGATGNTTNGGNVFNDDVTFTHNGTGQWSLGSSPAGDDYNGDVTYLRMNSGTLSMASTNTSTFAGNISTVGSSSNPLIATVLTGVAELDGNSNQIISGDIARSPLFGRMRINKTGGDVTLAVPINISSDINLTSGILNTDATNLLIVNNGATRTGGSDASHVNGPIRKVGTNAFEFPVGKGGFWRPISITGPGVATDHFTAEFFNTDPDAIDAVDPAPMDTPIENISDCEFWILDRTNGASNVSVTLSYRPYGANGCSGVTDLANLTIARWDGTTWVNHPSTGVGVPSGSITTNAVVTSFSPFALATFSSTNPLPIELINFTAIGTDQNVLLNWQTASEINNDYFEIERSTDGENFIPIQQVNGAGNSSQILNYSTIDYSPFIGINYYRLKQTDFDGAFSYSDVKQVNFISSDVLRVYPNPAQNEVFVQFNDEVVFDEITLTDVTGKIILVLNSKDKSLIKMDISTLSKGIYLLTCKGNGTILSQKIVVE
jgi:hypothetical protein